MPRTLYELIHTKADTSPDATAILAPGRSPLTYRGLTEQIQQTVGQLRAAGVGRQDRVALVLPNGPEMATAFLAVASCATSAPLNPAYRASDFEFYLADLQARAVIVPADFESPAREVAKEMHIPVINLEAAADSPAGCFRLVGYEQPVATTYDLARATDVALVLHTSGTTSRPKIVPLSQSNLCASSQNIATTLRLSPEDRCLNIMPLFHIHGLMAAVMASLSAGASTVCTPGLVVDRFFEWIRFFRPTWYTAVPTMHHVILDHAEAHRDLLCESPLRFIRSSSASLPPRVMAGLEKVFAAPVIEAYGMTEASHQMTSNPLPPAPRIPGTVGLPAGPDVAIMGERGDLLPHGRKGEVVIRGSNVTEGYENNAAANETAFTNGWFRTGDLGVMDDEGYLTIVGRLKEIINRGGEKVAPREVEEAFLEHPAVAEVAAFALPHTTLGEDLAVAVVCREGAGPTERELREFAFAHLPGFKVPTRVLLVQSIPKGPTGKVQRTSLAEKLAAELEADYVAPRNTLEGALAVIFAEALKLESVGIRDNFFSLGGDSLTATSVLPELERLANRSLHPAVLFEAPEIEQLAEVLQGARWNHETCLVPIQPDGDKTPLFCIPGHGGDVFTFLELARHLGPSQPVYSFRFPDEAARNNRVANVMVEEMAVAFVQAMQSVQPDGPYFLTGFCYGGEVGFAMANHLHAQDQRAALVAMVHAYLPGSIRPRWPGIGFVLRKHWHRLRQEDLGGKATYLLHFIRGRTRRLARDLRTGVAPGGGAEPTVPSYRRYYPGKLVLFSPIGEHSPEFSYDPDMGWTKWAAEIERHDVPGDKVSVFRPPHVEALAASLRRYLLVAVLLISACAPSRSEMADTDGRAAHFRIERFEAIPNFQLNLFDQPVEVFLPEGGLSTGGDPIDLLIHFHGAAFVPVEAARTSGRNYVVAVVNLGAGSSRYEVPFSPHGTFTRLLDAVSDSLTSRRGTPTLLGELRITSWSAGYGAVRAILREQENVEQIDGLLLLDGLHEDYDPGGALVPGGSRIDTTGMQPFLAFARRAVAGDVAMLVTHSAIVPGSYASTTETADYLIERLGLERVERDRLEPPGMRLQSETSRARFRVLGYPGETAADHVDHIHALPALLRTLQEL